MTATVPTEIEAPQRDLPRYCPGKPFPPYRYVPGAHPHPVRDPAGHSYGSAEPFGDLTGWRADDWRQLEPWLWGVDLFNHFYFWEAHEAWESLWRVGDEPTRLFLQGMIQIAAALLKVHQQSTTGALRLSTAAIDKLTRTSAATPHLMGADVAEITNEMRTYFSPLANMVLPSIDDGVPIVRLGGGADRGGRDHV